MDGLESVARYMVLQSLAGTKANTALYMYFMGASPREIESKLGVGRGMLRGYVQRVYERTRIVYAPIIVTTLYGRVSRIEPVIKNGICMICGEPAGQQPTIHIMLRHRNVVNSLVRKVVMDGR